MKVQIEAAPLHEVLQALVGPPHLMLELIAVSSVPDGEDPISKIITEYNDWATNGGQVCCPFCHSNTHWTLHGLKKHLLVCDEFLGLVL